MKSLTELFGILTLASLIYAADLSVFSEPIQYLVIVGYITTMLYLVVSILDNLKNPKQ